MQAVCVCMCVCVCVCVCVCLKMKVLVIDAQVMEHDTLNGIALKFDTTPSQLAHLNRKQLGMVTLIPGEVGLT